MIKFINTIFFYIKLFYMAVPSATRFVVLSKKPLDGFSLTGTESAKRGLCWRESLPLDGRGRPSSPFFPFGNEQGRRSKNKKFLNIFYGLFILL
jgi:hypothetical protein